MERTDSLQDLVGNLWRLGRTPSEAEFQLLTGFETESPLAGGAAGMHRVASIDILRKMLLTQQAAQALSAAHQNASASAVDAPASGSQGASGASAPQIAHPVGVPSGACPVWKQGSIFREELYK